VQGALSALADSTQQSVDKIYAEVVDRLRQLEDQSGAQQAEFVRVVDIAQGQFKETFADHSRDLDRLLQEAHREVDEVVERHVAEIERSLSSSTAEVSEIADQRFAEFDRRVHLHVEAIHEATAESLTDIDHAVDNRIGGVEQSVLAWARQSQAALSARVEEFAKLSHRTVRFAMIAVVIAVLAVGIAVAAVLSSY
jgi:hypothetical protein